MYLTLLLSLGRKDVDRDTMRALLSRIVPHETIFPELLGFAREGNTEIKREALKPSLYSFVENQYAEGEGMSLFSEAELNAIAKIFFLIR